MDGMDDELLRAIELSMNTDQQINNDNEQKKLERELDEIKKYDEMMNEMRTNEMRTNEENISKQRMNLVDEQDQKYLESLRIDQEKDRLKQEEIKKMEQKELDEAIMLSEKEKKT